MINILMLLAGLSGGVETQASEVNSVVAPKVSITNLADNTMISINSADAQSLSNLPGIGMKKAKAIVEYREKHGRFEHIQQLTEIKGIGRKILAKLEGKIKL